MEELFSEEAGAAEAEGERGEWAGEGGSGESSGEEDDDTQAQGPGSLAAIIPFGSAAPHAKGVTAPSAPGGCGKGLRCLMCLSFSTGAKVTHGIWGRISAI